jgi:hypothetical protein
MAKTATPMKLKDRLESLDDARPAAVTTLRPESLAATTQDAPTGGDSRKGKKATVGHFSEAMSRKLNAMAAMEGRTLQSIMGEAWDMWLENRGERPFNER